MCSRFYALLLLLLPLSVSADPAKIMHISSGTGFFVNSDSIITNAHVIKGCSRVTVKGAVPDHEVAVQVVDQPHDLALLYSDQPPEQFAPLRFNIDDLRPGDKVLVVGYPGMEGVQGVRTIAEAHVKKPIDPRMEEPGHFYISDVLDHGNSGGPVFDMSGNVIGVVVAKKHIISTTSRAGNVVRREQDLGVVISLNTLRQFLSDHGASAQWMSSGVLTFPVEHIQEQAHAVIVNVQCEVSRETVPAPAQR